MLNIEGENNYISHPSGQILEVYLRPTPPPRIYAYGDHRCGDNEKSCPIIGIRGFLYFGFYLWLIKFASLPCLIEWRLVADTSEFCLKKKEKEKERKNILNIS